MKLKQSTKNHTATRTGKVYLTKRDDTIILQASCIPNYVLNMYKQYTSDLVTFKLGKTKKHCRNYISVLRRYNLIEKKPLINAKADFAVYMRTYRQKKKKEQIKGVEQETPLYI